ncbi:MAG: hypothetical protein WA532_06460 [Candidatus Korobacteraceae bacterium]
MKPLLQIFFLLIAFALGLAHGHSLFATPDGIAHATGHPVVSSAQLPTPAAPIPPELRSQGDPDVPVKGSPLPLVSLIGFGLLISGILPAMRARKISGTHQ